MRNASTQGPSSHMKWLAPISAGVVLIATVAATTAIASACVSHRSVFALAHHHNHARPHLIAAR